VRSLQLLDTERIHGRNQNASRLEWRINQVTQKPPDSHAQGTTPATQYFDAVREALKDASSCLARFRGTHNNISVTLSKKVCGCDICMEFMRLMDYMIPRAKAALNEIAQPSAPSVSEPQKNAVGEQLYPAVPGIVQCFNCDSVHWNVKWDREAVDTSAHGWFICCEGCGQIYQLFPEGTSQLIRAGEPK
jgi:hypothetical protein